MKTNPAKGEYVLATKWNDGEAWDAWAVGFYDGLSEWTHGVRHLVVDAHGNSFRANGFRRVGCIEVAQGRWLLDNARELERIGTRLWELLPWLPLE